jgi:hypothetical protein
MSSQLPNFPKVPMFTNPVFFRGAMRSPLLFSRFKRPSRPT